MAMAELYAEDFLYISSKIYLTSSSSNRGLESAKLLNLTVATGKDETM